MVAEASKQASLLSAPKGIRTPVCTPDVHALDENLSLNERVGIETRVQSPDLFDQGRKPCIRCARCIGGSLLYDAEEMFCLLCSWRPVPAGFVALGIPVSDEEKDRRIDVARKAVSARWARSTEASRER